MSKFPSTGKQKAHRLGQVRPLPYLLITPAMVLFTLFTFYPFLKTIVLSFSLTNKSGNFTKWVGFSNWIRVLTKSSFWDVVVITLKMAAINLVFTFCLARQTEESDGFTVLYRGVPYIFYSNSVPETRQRFTIAHEIGHIVLGHVGDGKYTIRNR